jgi:shikimate 5-dehydrogenase
LPIISKKFDKLKQMLEILKVNGILTNRESGDEMLPLAEHYEEAARLGQYADLILKQDDGWHAYNSIWRSVIRVLEKTLGKSESDPRPLDKRNILVIGSSGLAQSIVYGLSKRKGLVSVSAPRDDDAQRIAQILDIRFIRFQNLYDTLADIVIFAEPSMKMGNSKKDFNPSFLRSSMVVGDVGCMPEDSELIVQARERGCKVLEPSELYAVQLATQLKSVTGKEIGAEELKAELESLRS